MLLASMDEASQENVADKLARRRPDVPPAITGRIGSRHPSPDNNFPQQYSSRESMLMGMRGNRAQSDRVLDAAALQDRLMRSMKLDLGGQNPRALLVVDVDGGGAQHVAGGGRRRRAKRRAARNPIPSAASQPGAPSSTTTTTAIRSGHHHDEERGTRMSTTRATTRVDGMASNNTTTTKQGTTTTRNPSHVHRHRVCWTCEACSAVVTIANSPNTLTAAAADSADNTSIVTFGGSAAPTNRTSVACCPVCLHPRPPSPNRGGYCRQGQERRVSVTLAQIRGLEQPPEPALTAGEWSVVEAKALARGDEASPCPICMEAFQGEGQVILSCSHVFHKACLASFERFLRAQERSCPLCRKVDYQKRATRQGAVAWRQRCARCIQRIYRGHKARREYRVLLRRHFAAGLGDPRRRREYLSEQAAERAGKLVEEIEGRGDSIDRLFDEFDRGLAFSRQIFGTPASAAAASAAPMTDGNPDGNETPTPDPSTETQPGDDNNNKMMKWKEGFMKAGERGEDECPICMCSMEAVQPGDGELISGRGEGRAEEGDGSGGTPDVSGDSRRGERRGRRRERRPRDGGERRARLLLSCSHVFHKACLMAFEGFNIYEVHLCPVCRQEYDSIDPSCHDHHHQRLPVSVR